MLNTYARVCLACLQAAAAARRGLGDSRSPLVEHLLTTRRGLQAGERCHAARTHRRHTHQADVHARAASLVAIHHGTCTSGSSSGRSRRGRLPAPFSVFSGMALGAAQGPLARTLGSGPVPFLGTCRALRFVKNCYIPLYRRPLVDAAPVITRPGSFYDCASCVCRVLLDIYVAHPCVVVTRRTRYASVPWSHADVLL